VNHQPFSTVVVDSYPSWLWFSLMSLQDKLQKLLSCKWKSALHLIQYEKNCAVSCHFSNLSMCTSSSYKSLSMISILNQDSFFLLKQLLGKACGIASWNMIPARGSGP